MNNRYEIEWLLNSQTWYDLYPDSVRQSVFKEIAKQSILLENGSMDQWDLHAKVLQDAYEYGATGNELGHYKFFYWHKGILPFGGMLRQCNAVSRDMGESFHPENYSDLPKVVGKYISNFNTVLTRPYVGYYDLAVLHHEAWRIHFWYDGNKRHARLCTNYACGYLQFPPIEITLREKDEYLDCLRHTNYDGLAYLFEKCED